MGYIGQAPTKVPLTSADITDGTIALADMAANSCDSDQYVDASIDNAHLADDAVGVAELSATGTASSSTFLRGDNAWAAAGGGKIVQVVNVLSGTVATGTTTMPYDDTIPQSGEGTEFLTLAITPTSATNKLLIEVDTMFGCSAAEVNVSAGLFQDSTAGALAAKGEGSSIINVPAELSMKHYMTAGTTSATTFKLRIGGASSSTITFNGTGGVRRLGACTLSSITIWEIEV